MTIPDAWARWSEAHGVNGISPLAGPQFDQFQTIIRAVMAGMGIALVPRCLVQDEIAAGLVNEPLPQHGYQSALATGCAIRPTAPTTAPWASSATGWWTMPRRRRDGSRWHLWLPGNLRQPGDAPPPIPQAWATAASAAP